MTKGHTPDTGGGPHWAAPVADALFTHAQTTRDLRTQAAASATERTVLIGSGGLAWVDELEAELVTIAAVVNGRGGRPMLTATRTLSGALSLRAASGAYIVFDTTALAHPDPEARTGDFSVVVQPDGQAHWRSSSPYALSVHAGALVIHGLGPAAFAAVVTEPWLRTLSLTPDPRLSIEE